jgi:hypothetical protein
VVRAHVRRQRRLLCELPAADGAAERAVTGVGLQMPPQVGRFGERTVAQMTMIRPFTGVRPDMDAQTAHLP